MSTKEKAVRKAAEDLHAAIVEARKSGLHVEWPASPDGLAAISISQTGKAETEEPTKAAPAEK